MKLTALAPLAILPLVAACGSSNDGYSLPTDSLYIGSDSSFAAAALAHEDAEFDVSTVILEGPTQVDDLPDNGNIEFVGTVHGTNALDEYYADLGMRGDLDSGAVDGAVSNFYFDDDSGLDGTIGLDGTLLNNGGNVGVTVGGDGTLSNGSTQAAYTIDLNGTIYGAGATAYDMTGTSSVGDVDFTTESVGTAN